MHKTHKVSRLLLAGLTVVSLSAGTTYAVMSFKDADMSSYYGKYLQWAADNGIVTGYSDGTFRPGNNVTRAELVTILGRYHEMMMKGGMMMDMDNPTVGGAAMMNTKDIIDNAVNSPIHKTLVAAVKAAGLVETLKGEGPFTVFAPTDDAFGKLPSGTVDTLLKPENKSMLVKVLTYHVIAGKLKASDLTDGKVLTTVAGGKLTVMRSGDKIMLKDEMGGMSMITISNVFQSNGVIHVVDTVLMPK